MHSRRRTDQHLAAGQAFCSLIFWDRREHASNRSSKRIHIERFGEIVVCPGSQGSHGKGFGTVSTYDQEGWNVATVSELREGLQARFAEMKRPGEHHQFYIRVLCDGRCSLVRIAQQDRPPVSFAQQGEHRQTSSDVIADNEDVVPEHSQLRRQKLRDPSKFSNLNPSERRIALAR